MTDTKRPRVMSFFEEPGKVAKYSGTRLVMVLFGLTIAVVWAKTSWSDGPKPIDPTITLFFFGIILAAVAPKFFAAKFGGVGAADLAEQFGSKAGISTEKTTTETITVTPQEPPK